MYPRVILSSNIVKFLASIHDEICFIVDDVFMSMAHDHSSAKTKRA